MMRLECNSKLSQEVYVAHCYVVGIGVCFLHPAHVTEYIQQLSHMFRERVELWA